MRRTVAAVLGLTAVVVGVEARDTRLPGWFDLPIAGGEATLAALGIEPDERAMTLPVLSRALEDRQSRLGRAPDALQRMLDQTTAGALGGTPDAEATVVPAPLSAEVWRELLEVAPQDDLFRRLSGNRRALMVAVGLMATDDSIRSLMARDRDLLSFVHREGASAFAIVARSLRIDRDRVVVPGGQGAETIWQRLAGSSTDQPSAFLRALVSRDRGRLAWYFDCLAQMDDGRLAAAWPDNGSRCAPRQRRGALRGVSRERCSVGHPGAAVSSKHRGSMDDRDDRRRPGRPAAWTVARSVLGVRVLGQRRSPATNARSDAASGVDLVDAHDRIDGGSTATRQDRSVSTRPTGVPLSIARGAAGSCGCPQWVRTLSHVAPCARTDAN